MEDQEAEKSKRTEFVTSVGGLVSQVQPLLQENPDMIPLFGEILLFAVRGFRVGSQLEFAVEQYVEKARTMMQEAPPGEGGEETEGGDQDLPPQPDPVDQEIKVQTAMQDNAANQQLSEQKIRKEFANANSAELKVRQQEIKLEKDIVDLQTKLARLKQSSQNQMMIPPGLPIQ